MVPTRRLAVFAFLATLLALVAGYAGSLRPALALVDAVLVLGVVIDVAFSAGRRVDVDRQAPVIFSVGRPNLVTVHLRNRSGRALRGTFADDPLEACDPVGNPGVFELPPHGTTAVRYELVPSRRGPRDFGAVTVRYPSPLGLVA